MHSTHLPSRQHMLQVDHARSIRLLLQQRQQLARMLPLRSSGAARMPTAAASGVHSNSCQGGSSSSSSYSYSYSSHGSSMSRLNAARPTHRQRQQQQLLQGGTLASPSPRRSAAAVAAWGGRSPPHVPAGVQHTHVLRGPPAAVAASATAAADPGSSQPDQRQQPPPANAAAATPPAAAAAAAALDLPPLDLPPSRSAALWLHDLSDAQLQQAAADWGYAQVGRPLPEGLSLTAIAETLPEQVFDLNLFKALGYLGLSLAVMAAGYAYLAYWHSICPLWQQLVAWAVIGTGYYGVFQTAVDCAHFAFWPQRPLLQDVLGAALMAPALVSYELYRLKYLNHIMCTNQLHEDLDAWHPLLPADLAAMPAWRRTLTALLMATPLKLLASVGQWARSLEGFDLRLHPRQTRVWVWLSWALPLGFVAAVWPALIAAGGLSGLMTYWLGPWLAFHAWLSVLSLLQHTGPHITWAEEGLTYDQAQAVINGTVNLRVPRWLEVLLHHTNHHLPTHVSISIPSYNLPQAQRYLEQRLGKYLTIATLNANLLRQLVTAWVVYDEQQQRYVDLDEAEPLVQHARRQQEQEQQQQQQDGQQQQAQQHRQQQGAAAANTSSVATNAAGGAFVPRIPLGQLLGGTNAQHTGSTGAGARSNNDHSISSSSSGSGASSGASNSGQAVDQQHIACESTTTGSSSSSTSAAV